MLFAKSRRSMSKLSNLAVDYVIMSGLSTHQPAAFFAHICRTSTNTLCISSSSRAVLARATDATSDSHEVFILHFQLRSEGFRLWGQPAMDSLGIFILCLSTRWVWKQGPCSKNMKYLKYDVYKCINWCVLQRIWRNSTESIFSWHPTDLLITSGTSAWSIASKAQVLAICRSAARPKARWHSRAPGNPEKRESSDQVESSDILEPEEWGATESLTDMQIFFVMHADVYHCVSTSQVTYIEKPALNPNIKKISSMGWRAIWNVKSSFSLAFRSQSWRCSRTTSWKCDKLLRRSDLWVWANMLSSQSASRIFKRHDLTTWWPEPCSVAVLCSVASIFVEWKIFESQGIQGRLAMLWCTDGVVEVKTSPPYPWWYTHWFAEAWEAPPMDVWGS